MKDFTYNGRPLTNNELDQLNQSLEKIIKDGVNIETLKQMKELEHSLQENSKMNMYIPKKPNKLE